MLTPQQIEEARQKIGINTSKPSQSIGGNLLNKLEAKNQTFGQDIVGDFKGIGKDILSSSQKRGENIQKIKTEMETGTKGNIPAILETAGQLAGSASDAIAAATKGAVKMVLGPKSEQKVKELVTTFGQKVLERPEVHKIVSWYDKLPDDKKDAIDAVGGFASLAGDFIGLGAAEKTAKAGVGAVKTGAEQIAKTTGDIATSTKKIAGEIIPKTEGIVNYQVTRALDLTQGDVKNIAKSTGNEVGEFLASKNLIAGNKDETAKMVKDFYEANYKTVRDEISKVVKTYSPYNVPRYTESLKAIKKQVDGIPGLEKVSVEVDNLLNKGKNQISLNDAQRVKELLDEHFNLYKVTGDVKEGVQKEGLANLRKDLKEFIEKEVKDNTGADIASLNNDVSTSRSIVDAIETRSTRGLTTSNLKIGDLGVFGVGSALGSPILGIGAVIAKKIVESSAIRLKIARYLDKISDARKLKIKNSIMKGKIPEEIIKVVDPQSTLIPKASIKNMNSQNVSIPKTITQNIPNKQGGVISIEEIAKSIDNTDKDIMQAFIDKINIGKTPTKIEALKAQELADTIGLKSALGTNKAIAKDFTNILDITRQNFKKKMK